MPVESTLPPPLEDGKDSDDVVENWKFKIYIGGRVWHQPTVHYLGGQSWDYAITPKEMNIDKIHDIIEELVNDEKVRVREMYYKRPKFSMEKGLTVMDRECDFKKMVRTWNVLQEAEV
ncbi:hypothetical protein ACFE04_019028 [Oxalis oulophora]